MNEKCKYCDYVSKCSRNVEYGSLFCTLYRSFPKVVDKSYEDLIKENKKLKEINTLLNEKANNQIDELFKKNKAIKEVKTKLLDIQNKYGYILDDVIFILERTDK